MKNLLIIISIWVCSLLEAQTVTIPTNDLLVDSSLYELSYNNWVTGGLISPVKSNGNTTFDIRPAFEPTLSEIVQILNAGGEINNYQMVIKAPLSFLDENVNSSLPNYQKQTSTGLQARTYGEWFKYSDIYVEGSDVYCITVTISGYVLTASEVRTIIQSSSATTVVLVTSNEFINVQN